MASLSCLRGETAPGATLPGFEVADARAPELLALAGRHRFSRYRLVFELDEVEPGRTRVRASTWAAFPGLAGHAYRALVIGTRGHRLAVRRILGRIRPGAAPGLSG